MTDAPAPDAGLAELLARIVPGQADPAFIAAADAARARWETRAKPPGSLGRLETVAVTVAGITGRCPPPVPTQPAVVVFAADHGVVADGASAWPSEITGAMVRSMAAGGAAINAFAATVGAAVSVVDVGVDADLSDVEDIVDAKVRPGTASIAHGPAMTRDEALTAIGVGAAAATVMIDDGADLLVGGDMGIGNTTPSTALIAHWTKHAVAGLVGPGAGAGDDAALDRKRALVEAAVERAAGLDDPVDVLAAIGGLEIAALAGFHLGATARHVPIIVDGVIALAAVVVAEAMAPGLATRVLAGHRSSEPAASVALDHLGLVPLLDLDLRLGEGTGACLAVPLVQAATRALATMADLPT